MLNGLCETRLILASESIKKLLLIMKLTAIILLSACLTACANGHSQNVTLTLKNAPLETVFSEIKKQTGYSVFYNYKLLDNAKPVTISVKNVSVDEVMKVCLKDQPLDYDIADKSIVIKAKERPKTDLPLLPPTIDVKGKVINDKGESLVVTVTVKGTGISTTTNEKGEFELKGIDEKAILVITGVNIETREVKVDGKANLAISVKAKITEGQEVIVTAYGIEKRAKELGYSAARVTGEEINRASPSNILTGLTGKVSGLSINATSASINPQMRVLLRGIRSFGEGSNNLPLIIVNGAPLSFGADQQAATVMMDFINNINPNDIESVNILKGANGAALYGPEGVNGVIIINTKKGKIKPTVNFRHSTMLQVLDTRYPKIQKQFGSGSFADQFGNGIYDPFGGTGNWGPAFTGEMIQIGRPDENGELQIVPYQYTKERYKFWNTAQTIQNNVSVSQGDSKSDFYFSAGHTYLKGLIPGDKDNRYSILLNTGRQFGKIQTRVNIGYTRSQKDVYPGQPNVLETPAHIPITSYKDFRNDKWSDRNHFWDDDGPNIYEEIAINRLVENSNALYGNLSVTFKPASWLTITNRLGTNYYGIVGKQTQEPIVYSEFGKTNGRLISGRGDQLAAVFDVHNVYVTLSNDLLLNTQFNLGKFSLRTTLGNSLRNNNNEKIQSSATSLLVPVYNVLYNSVPADVSQVNVLSRSYSFFGTNTLGYKDWAFLEITGRKDWDSKIADIARNKNYYYGANTSVVLGEAIPSLVNNKVLSALRLRASVTKTANMNIEPYQAESILNVQSVYANVLSFRFNTNEVPNPNIKPENVISQEYGLAVGFLKNRLHLDATYYRQKNDGVIANRELSIFAGGARTIDNIGSLLNYGWEFDIKLDPFFKLPFGLSCNAEGTFSINNNRVLKLGEIPNSSTVPGISTGLGNYALVLGEAAYAYRMTDWLRDEQGRVIVSKTTGMPIVDYANPKIIGRTLPKYMASFNVHLAWKNIGLHLVGEYRGGNEHYFRNGYSLVRSGTAEVTAQYGRQKFIFPNSVYDDGTGKYVPNTDVVVRSGHAEFYNLFSQVETNFLTSGAFFKLRELSLSYDWKPKSNLVKLLTFTLAARNLLNFYPKTNRWGDPELSSGAGTRVNESQTSASNINGVFSEGFIGGTRFFGISLNAGF